MAVLETYPEAPFHASIEELFGLRALALAQGDFLELSAEFKLVG